MRVYMAIAALMYGPYIRAYIAITALIYMWPLLPLHMAQSYIYMAVAARIHGHCYPDIYMAVTTPPLLRLTTIRPRRLNNSRLHKEYEQNHNTIEPAPLGIEPNMIYIET